jgi:hypothetical protein
MAMKRKPHQAGLDPTKPGAPVTQADLRKGSQAYHKEQHAKMKEAGITPGALAGAEGMPGHEVPENLTGVDRPSGGNGQPEPPVPPQRPPQAPPAGAQAPEPPIPAGYQAGEAAKLPDKEDHPLLAELEENFGIKKLQVKTLELAGYRWTFRPMSFQDYEWMTTRAAAMGTSEPSLSAAGIAAQMAAINGTPIYEIFDIPVQGRHIPDPNNPPPDIRYEAAEYLLGWLREKVGMWELIGELDEKIDILFEEDRKEAYPLWETLASPYRRRLVELRENLMEEMSSEEQDGNSGEGASPTQPSSPQTKEQGGSGTTPDQQSSTSTGASG